MEFPRFVFKRNGPHDCQLGKYDQHLVEDEKEHSAAIKAGWGNDLADAFAASGAAVGGGSAPPSDNNNGDNDNAQPTRAEMEAKAKELGIKLPPKIGDKKLLDRINEKLAEGK